MSYKNVSRITRLSQKTKGTTKSTINASVNSVNTSYETIIHDETRNSSPEKLSIDQILADLRNKLASSHSLNAELQAEILSLKNDVKAKNNQIMILDGKLNFVLLSKRTATDSSTQTILELSEAGTQVEHNSSLALETNDKNCQTDFGSMAVNDFHCANSREHRIVSADTLPVISEECLTLIPEVEVDSSIKKVTSNEKLDVLLIKPKIHLITDEVGRDLSSLIKNKFPSHYSITATVKSGDTFENITRYVEDSSKAYTKSDRVIVLVNSRHACDNTVRFMKRQVSKLISGLNHTNLLMATIPYRYDDFSHNEFIHQINQHIEDTLFKYNDKLCLYTNKILIKTDFNKRNYLGSSGMHKLVGVIYDYVINGRSDDRSTENQLKVLHSTFKNVEPVTYQTCKPSISGSTTIVKKSLRTVPKNKRPIRRNKLMCLLKELLSILA